VRVRGVDLAVADAGGMVAGPAFVWTHGLGSSMAHEDETRLVDWSPIVRSRSIRYDVRGHGESGFTSDPNGYRWDELAADLWALLDRLGVERAVLGGASMGAATSLHAAVAESDRVVGLVLAIPPTAWTTRPEMARLYLAAAALIERRGLGAYIAACRSQREPAVFTGWLEGLWEGLYRSWEADAVEVGRRLPTIFRGCAESDLPEPDRIAALEVPSLVLGWVGDDGHPEATVDRLAELLPATTVDMAEDADRVATWPAQVGSFLAAHATSTASSRDSRK
jgi:pimeloyl-ACP methyl ester carboxylesterase